MANYWDNDEVVGTMPQTTSDVFNAKIVSEQVTNQTQPTSVQTQQTSLAPSSTSQATFSQVEAKGYDTLYGNFEVGNTPFKGYTVSTKTVGELIDFSQASGEYGQYVKPRLGKDTEAYKKGLTSTPMGRYQVVGATLRDTVKRMGLPLDTVFNKEVQDAMFLFLAKENIAKGKTPGQKRANLRSIWEGFKKVDDQTLDSIIYEVSS
jgi:muramidase (phage lysozyme)|tara:strand:- start:5141 stop:5758 length:618 start_codon:yes stop_codon:yes gene_type:complete